MGRVMTGVSDVKKDHSMIEQTFPELPTSTKSERKTLRQAEINDELWAAIEPILRKNGLTTRSLFEWGIRAYLWVASNPKKARDLGIKGLDN